jgi:hypothetical protein
MVNKSAILAILFSFVLAYLSPPFIGGLYYSSTGHHAMEQAYLDRCISYLKQMRTVCDDPDLQGVLDYTIERYNTVGPWDVMFMPLPSWPNKTLGCNYPLCPGVTLDTGLLRLEPNYTALILVHEALHDYPPYLGHSHINEREKKLYELSRRCPKPANNNE